MTPHPPDLEPHETEPPTAAEAVIVLGAVAVVAVTCWLLYGPIIRAMCAQMCAAWLG